MGHVPDRVDVHEHADRGDDDQEAGRQVVDVEADVDVEAAGRDPVPELDVLAVFTERRRVPEGGATTPSRSATDERRSRRPARAPRPARPRAAGRRAR